MNGGSPKAVLYAGFARVGRALASPARIELLNLLAQGEHGVEELAGAAGLKVSNTSAQLKALAEAGLVTSRRSGTRVLYRIADPQVTGLAELVKQVAFGLQPGVREAARGWLGDPAALEPMTRSELALRMRAGGVLVLDVRPAAEYAAGHIAGAVSFPVGEMPTGMHRLPKEREIVAYCRGRFCVMSLEAVRLLRGHGYRARPMDGGLPEWRDEGMPVASAWP